MNQLKMAERKWVLSDKRVFVNSVFLTPWPPLHQVARGRKTLLKSPLQKLGRGFRGGDYNL
jgi:hypothetical protein